MASKVMKSEAEYQEPANKQFDQHFDKNIKIIIFICCQLRCDLYLLSVMLSLSLICS